MSLDHIERRDTVTLREDIEEAIVRHVRVSIVDDGRKRCAMYEGVDDASAAILNLLHRRGLH